MKEPKSGVRKDSQEAAIVQVRDNCDLDKDRGMKNPESWADWICWQIE